MFPCPARLLGSGRKADISSNSPKNRTLSIVSEKTHTIHGWDGSEPKSDIHFNNLINNVQDY